MDKKKSKFAAAQISEDVAKIRLLKLGYEIFEPHFHTTPIDILAYKNGKFIKLQVKSLFKRTTRSDRPKRKTPQYQAKLAKTRPVKGYDGKFSNQKYNSKEIDGFVLVHETDNICVFLPINKVKNTITVSRTKKGWEEYKIEKILSF